MSTIDKYINKMNSEIFPVLNSKKLTNSDGIVEVLAKFKKAFMDVYETDCINRDMDKVKADEGFIVVPGLIRAKSTGKIRVALLDIDVSSSGEHWGTTALTEYGLVSQKDRNKSKKAKEFFDEFIPYDYCYCIDIEDDIHIDKDDIHPDMKNILDRVK